MRAAARANRRGHRLLDAGDHAGAAAAFAEVLALHPEAADVAFNLALAHKLGRRWGDAREAGLRAAELQPDDYATWWNLGIVATALGDWPLARRAWQRCEVPLPDDEGPIQADFGFALVRLNPEGDAEVVWGQRIDPARMELANVPFRESRHRWGDVVLNDGVPTGERERDGERYLVFDELERLEPGPWPTTEVHLRAAERADVDALVDALDGAEGTAEDWTSSVRHLCAACSAGSVETPADADSWSEVRHLGVATDPDRARGLFAAWREQAPDARDVIEVR